METVKEVTAAVLAGGKSRRMGRDKVHLEIRGRTMLGWVLGSLTPLFETVIIIGANAPVPEDPSIPVCPDLMPGKGSLGGILTALRRSPTEEVFCTACDTPFIRPELVAHLVRLSEGGKWDAVVPAVEEEMEPLCAVYCRRASDVVERDIRQGVRKIKTTLSSLRVRTVDGEELRRFDPELLSFFNVNTPEDLERARAIAAAKEGDGRGFS
jgi:molybdopterin-guanine dinucleotide biosynthesis protein A